MLEVPFYLNNGHRCAQAAMKSVLKAVLPERDFSLRELDRLTQHSRDQITFPSQIASGFKQLSVNFQYYVKPNWLDLVLSDQLEEHARQKYDEYTDELLAKTNVGFLRESVTSFKKDTRVIEADRKPSIDELEKMIQNGRIPICLINYDVFVDRENQFVGHYLVLTGFENGIVVYHDNGPKGAGANKKVSRERFKQAWDLCFFDHDLIVV